MTKSTDLLTLEARRAGGQKAFTALMGGASPRTVTPLEESYELFLFAEVWARPGLDRRARLWVALSCLGGLGNIRFLEPYVRAALQTGEATLSEMREFTLHFAVYCGWPQGLQLDQVVGRIAQELGLAEDLAPLQTQTLHAATRIAEGAANYQSVMTFPPPKPDCPFYLAIHNYVFGEMWDRPGLDRRSRRWITLACVGICDTEVPIRTHIYAALNSKDATPEEMQEFVLHFAAYAGWPKASLVQLVTSEMIARVANDLGYI